MGAGESYRADDFIRAIPGSGGIISVIAKRVGCTWHTASRYINLYATVKKAYESECQAPLDMAEAIILRNMELARKIQENEGKVVDSGDARWMLTMKGGDRGYAPKQRIEQSGDLSIKLTWDDNDDADD
jgi:hypothetical protein